MLLKILLTFFIVFIASSQPNYQDRVTYYNEQDNVCCNYFTSDFMNLIININNQETIKYKLSGNTRCYIWAIDFLSSISTNDTTQIRDNTTNTYIKFSQLMRREASVDTRSIIQRVTVLTPSTIKGNSYNCVILGDGKKQHYGIDNTQNPATIYLKCSLENIIALNKEPIYNLRLDSS